MARDRTAMYFALYDLYVWAISYEPYEMAYMTHMIWLIWPYDKEHIIWAI